MLEIYYCLRILESLVCNNKNGIFIIAGEVKALNNIWLVGDDFLAEIYHILPGIRAEAKANKKDVPYIYEYYNITCITSSPSSSIKTPLVRMTNALIKGLNDFIKLPKYIVVIPDNDI